MSGSIHNVSDVSHLKFSILTVSPLTPLFFILHNKHTSQSFCSLTLRLCRLSEQSQEKSRDREKVKEGKRKELWGEKEREGRGCSVSPFSVAARNRKMTQIRRVCFMSWEQIVRGTRLITFTQYFCFRTLLSIFFTTRNNVGHLLISSFSFPPLFSPLLYLTFLQFYFVQPCFQQQCLVETLMCNQQSFSLNVISHRGKHIKSLGHNYSIINK